MAGILYKSSNVTGVKWRRFSRIAIHNPYNETPSISIMADDLVEMPGVAQPVPAGSKHISVPFDPAKLIDLRNPVTDEMLWTTISQAEIYAILYSVCRQLDEESQG